MAKKLDPHLLEILLKYDEKPDTALWDCHGTWVAYHSAIERIAARAGVTFDMPEIVEACSADKIVAITVRGFMGDRAEWSFGEAAPGNNKNSYPYAMAEKRAKDRVVLKLVGLHGLVYSEEESDDFKPNGRPQEAPVSNVTDHPTRRSSASLKREEVWKEFQAELNETTGVTLTKFALAWSAKAETDGWPSAWRDAAKEEINKRREELRNAPFSEEEFPGDTPLMAARKSMGIE